MHERKFSPFRHVRLLTSSKMVGRHDNVCRMQFSFSASLDGISRHCLKIPAARLLCGNEALKGHSEKSSSGNFEQEMHEKKALGTQLKDASDFGGRFLLKSISDERRKTSLNYIINKNRCKKYNNSAYQTRKAYKARHNIFLRVVWLRATRHKQH